jgi:phytanoyl-CoA hydroxylase
MLVQRNFVGKFSRRNMRLSEQQLQEYAQKGYLLLPALIDQVSLDAYNTRFLDIVGGQAELSGAMKIMRDVMIVKGAVQPKTPLHGVNKLFCLEDDPILFGFAKHPELVGAVKSILGHNVYSLTSNVFNKPPELDGRHPMHQDLRYFKLRPDNKIIGVWTAILPASRCSGCLSVVPGSHRQGMLSHDLPDWEYVNSGFLGASDVDMGKRLHIEMQPGDTLLFHPLLLHGSGRNKSTSFRRSISVHFASGDCVSPKTDWKNLGQTRRVS